MLEGNKHPHFHTWHLCIRRLHLAVARTEPHRVPCGPLQYHGASVCATIRLHWGWWPYFVADHDYCYTHHLWPSPPSLTSSSSPSARNSGGIVVAAGSTLFFSYVVVYVCTFACICNIRSYIVAAMGPSICHFLSRGADERLVQYNKCTMHSTGSHSVFRLTTATTVMRACSGPS